MEKAQKIKGKVIAAMFYPCAVLVVATAIMGVLMVVVIPKFKDVFAGGLAGNQSLPGFTLFIMGISDAIRKHILWSSVGFVVAIILFELAIHTKLGRKLFDQFKLKVPVFGPVFTKVAISRFTRTLGTLVSSGVPILQALTIVKETSGNVIIAKAVSDVHESVKEGETITAPLEASRVFPPMVISMVDVGEQTGALPEMLMKIADNYDEEVDNAVAAMTSLLEPIMIVFLAVVVGSIVIAMFLPLITLMESVGDTDTSRGGVAETPGH
jgi:type IV pilus assembly protein PilC